MHGERPPRHTVPLPRPETKNSENSLDLRALRASFSLRYCRLKRGSDGASPYRANTPPLGQIGIGRSLALPKKNLAWGFSILAFAKGRNSARGKRLALWARRP